jgi:hypothetical protein
MSTSKLEKAHKNKAKRITNNTNAISRNMPAIMQQGKSYWDLLRKACV